MKIYEDEHVGKKIGIYEILYLNDYKSKDGHKVYHIKCTECGWENDIQYRFIKELSQICKHLSVSGYYTSFNGKKSWTNRRIKRAFDAMYLRCYDENNKDYRWYGAKGVQICNEWLKNPLSFETWSTQNGYRNDLTIDRIDSDGDYSPENCQWIPLKENSRKAGKVNWITVNGETLTGRQWAEKLNLGVNRINTIIRERGLDAAENLIRSIIEDPGTIEQRGLNQSLLSIYDVKIDC